MWERYAGIICSDAAGNDTADYAPTKLQRLPGIEQHLPHHLHRPLWQRYWAAAVLIVVSNLYCDLAHVAKLDVQFDVLFPVGGALHLGDGVTSSRALIAVYSSPLCGHGVFFF